MAKPKKTKPQGKLKRFFSNRRNVAMVAVVLIFAVVGSYKLYQSSAQTSKAPVSVSNCYVLAVQGGSDVWLRYGDKGGCVLTYTRALAAVDNATGDKLGHVIVDDFYSTVVKEDTIKYQKDRGIEASGTVGPQTWRKLHDECAYISNAGNDTVRSACRYVSN